MKLKQLFFLTLVMATLSLNPLLADPDRMTSKEWFAIRDNDRMEFVQMAMNQLQDQNVPLSKTASEYLKDINDLFAQKPDMPAAAISVVLPSIVYKTEPGSRVIMDKLIKKHDIEIIKTI